MNLNIEIKVSQYIENPVLVLPLRYASKIDELYKSEENIIVSENGILEDVEKDWFFACAKKAENNKKVISIDDTQFVTAMKNTFFAAVIGIGLKNDAEIKTVKTSMVGIYHRGIYRRMRGLYWVDYPKSKMKIHLRKGMYNICDPSNLVVYSEKMEGLNRDLVDNNQLRSSTYGNYPEFTINFDEEYLDLPKYARDLILHALTL